MHNGVIEMVGLLIEYQYNISIRRDILVISN